VKLFLIRHGESTWNVEGRYQGRQDPPLSPRGQEQARALATRLREEAGGDAGPERLAEIVSSPLSRALDTARICAKALGLKVRVDDRLTEICHGDWEGKRRDEIASLWPDAFAAWRSTPHLVRFTGGESLGDVQSRLEAFVENLRSSASPLLVVTHDIVVRLAILMAENKPLSSIGETRADNAAINEFELAYSSRPSGRLSILEAIRVNDTTHLGPLRSDTSSQAL
jgi:probable phosphoglycerate mutase